MGLITLAFLALENCALFPTEVFGFGENHSGIIPFSIDEIKVALETVRENLRMVISSSS
jgi:hypothetical protein